MLGNTNITKLQHAQINTHHGIYTCHVDLAISDTTYPYNPLHTHSSCTLEGTKILKSMTVPTLALQTTISRMTLIYVLNIKDVLSVAYTLHHH